MKTPAMKSIAVALVLLTLGALGNLRAATIDLGLQFVSDNLLADSAGADLGAGSVFIGNWKDGVVDYSATLASVVTAASAMPDPVAALGGELAAYFTIGVSNSWSGLRIGGPDSLYVYTISSDVGLASRFMDVVFFNVGASEFGSVRWNSTWPGTEDLARSADVALAVPSLDPDAAPAMLAGTLADNLDGTGQFQTIPEPSSGILALGAACLWGVVRGFHRKS